MATNMIEVSMILLYHGNMYGSVSVPLDYHGNKYDRSINDFAVP